MIDGLLAVMYKELVQLRRDPATRIVFAVPVIQMLIFGFAIDPDIKHVPAALLDLDRSAESRRFVERLENTQTFDLVEEVDTIGAARRSIVAGRTKAAIVVPHDFASNVIAGRPASIQVLIDGSESTVASSAMMSAALTGQVSSMRAIGADPANAAYDVRPLLLFNPDLESARFYVPGLVGIILQLVTILLTSFAIVRERERGTLEQLAVTPISRWALVLGKLAPYAIIGVIQTVLLLLLLRLMFGVSIEGSRALLMSLSILFLLPALAMGILISTVARTQMEAMQLAFLVLLPSVLLSGFAFPRENMPLPIYAISNLLPVTYYVQILRGIILRGAGMWALWPQTLVLCAFTVVLVGLSAARFKKRLA